MRERRHEVLRRQGLAALLQVRKVDSRLRDMPRYFRTSSPGPTVYRSDESDVARNATVKMFNDLRVAFGELIEEAEWMDRGEWEGTYLGRIRPMDLKDPPIQQFLIDFDGSRSFSTGSFASFCKLIWIKIWIYL